MLKRNGRLGLPWEILMGRDERVFLDDTDEEQILATLIPADALILGTEPVEDQNP